MPLRHRRVLRHLQVLLTTLVVLAAAALILGAWWINRKGFTGEWADKITEEMNERGVHADFRSVRFSPWHGLMVRDVVVFADADREEVIAEIPRLQIDIDRAEALRGHLNLRQLKLRDAKISLPYQLPGPTPRDVSLENLTANVILNREGRLTLKDGVGSIVGIDFDLNLSLDGFNLRQLSPSQGPGPDPEPEEPGQFVTSLLRELSQWRFPGASPPRIEMTVAGDVRDRSNLNGTLALRAGELSRNNYTAEEVYLSAEYHRDRFVIDHFEFSDGAGKISGQAAYHLPARSGRYDISSGIHLGRLLRTCFGIDTLNQVMAPQAPTIKAAGRFVLGDEPGDIDLTAQGRVEVPPFVFRNHNFTSLSTEFSWRNGDIYLRDLDVRDARGGLQGDIRIKGDEILFEVVSSFFPEVFDPFIKDDGGLDRTIKRADFDTDERARIEIAASGRVQKSNPRNWSSQGQAKLRHFSYNGVPLASATSDFRIDAESSSFENITASFDYRDYALHKRHGGPSEATVTATRIGYGRKTKVTTLDNIEGTAWPAPVLRLFAPKTANYVERTYRTHRLPSFVARGTVAERNPNEETSVEVDITIPGVTDYKFLGKDLQLSDATLDLRVGNRRVDVSNLTFDTFSGSGGGNITVLTPSGAPARYNGQIKWTRLHLAEIGQTYGFEKAEQGLVTGFFKFDGTANRIRSLNGQGAIGLENGHLFYVPVLGPLSTILGEIVGDKRRSHEEARDASCTFAVENGVFHTSDFLTSTPSSTVTGEGQIDFNNSEIDMTMRMNARGLLGIITLPLRPLTGLFQFRGTGPLKNPVWRNSNFTSPARGKDDPIFRKPGRAQVVDE